ncbi:MAG: PaaI family thioesterase [Alphaproteobacteria bacterium]|jgi:acyl-coenzyme A thioesterase PaaI-like protein|nr:PaaI family thioesterase [Alphaproteobacteria bacterium]MDP6830482.1 PaaI family thioesterase [Alphaproteobacteria bacterium]
MTQQIELEAPGGTPEGYHPFTRSGPYGDCIGPIYFRRNPAGGFRYAFRTRAMHANPNGVTHGGALYSFADHITGHSVAVATKRNCATIKFKVEYLAAAPLDALIEAEVELLRITRTIVFLRLRVFAGEQTLMTADGSYKLFEPFEIKKSGKPKRAAAPKPSGPPPDDVKVPPPEGFLPYPDQGAFAEVCGPTYYRRLGDGGFLNGFQARPLHDNSNKIVHGGVLFAFGDDIMGRASSGVSRRYTTTVAMNVEYLAPAPLDAWIEGTAEITRMDEDFTFLRSRVFHGKRTLLTADGVYRLLGPYQKKKPEAVE